MNVSPVVTRDYKKKPNWALGENEPKTNPIKANFKKAKMNVTSILTVGYENKPHIWAPKKRTQFSKRQKPIQTSLPKGIMKKPRFRVPTKQTQTNPNKPNFKGKKAVYAFFNNDIGCRHNFFGIWRFGIDQRLKIA
jgi:hypothetical protein